MLNRPEVVGGLRAMLLGEIPLNPPFAKGGDFVSRPQSPTAEGGDCCQSALILLLRKGEIVVCSL